MSAVPIDTTGDVVVRTSGLIKDYRQGGRGELRTVRALDGVDLEVRRGEVFGFLGPNGAGKTTTLRILTDQLRPTAGEVRVLGATPRQGGAALRARIGYLPGELHLGGRATAGELLVHLARLRPGTDHARIGELAARLGLDLGRPVHGLSKGNKQKIGVAQAFLHDPELLLLDEPTSGLDPLLQHEVLALVREARDRGASVVLSSHVLSEVEQVAGRVAIIRAGRIVDVDDVATLRHRAGQRVELSFAAPVDAAPFAALTGVTDVQVDAATVRCQLHGEPDALIKLAARHHVVRWRAEDRELEELFLDHYRVAPVPTEHQEDSTDAR